jgi:hypothetical protein
MNSDSVCIWHFACCIAVAAAACGGSADAPSPTSPGAPTATVRIVYRASVSPRTDLPQSLATCVSGVGQTHIHPSWRAFVAVPLQAQSNQWEITFTDVPTTARQSIRVSDGNVCDENPTGAATRNIFANDVLLTQIVTTPGSGPEPGLAFGVDTTGRVTP